MSTRKKLYAFIAVALAAAVLGGFFFARKSPQGDSLFAGPTPVFRAAPGAAAGTDIGLPSPRPPRAGYTEYQSATYHFSLFYPQGLNPGEYKEPGTAMTVTFDEPFNDRGFQVFVVPYGEEKITPERFKADIPSGIIASSTSILVDGVPAEAFYSFNRVLGDTYEVWFIYHGFLYEVTTYKAYDAWLGEILSTWKFL